jgi:hypothetical protein
MDTSSIIPVKDFNKVIFLIRGQKVMLSTDLARLYEVEPKVLIQAAKRNIERFPEDFMFQLSRHEYTSLRSQIVTLKQGEHSKYLPYAYTEQGIAMLSSVLRSERAIKVNIEIMRSFVKLRQLLQTNAELAEKLKKLERKHDRKFRIVFQAIYQLMKPDDESSKSPIGFNT